MKKIFHSGNQPDHICLPITQLLDKFMIDGFYKKSHYRLVFNQYPEFVEDVLFNEKITKFLRHRSNGINNPLALLSNGFKELGI